MSSDFEAKVAEAAQRAVLKLIAEGQWVQPDYSNRIVVPKDWMTHIWGLVDRDRVAKQIAELIEGELAARVVNAIAAELATDIKQILSVPERREAVRALARKHLANIMQKGLPG